RAPDRHLPRRAGAPGPRQHGGRWGGRAGPPGRADRGGGGRVRRPVGRYRGGVGLPRRQPRGAGAPVLQKGPGGDVRPGGPLGTEGDLLRRLGAGRVGARPGIRGQAARLHPAAAPGRGGGSGVGDRLRLGQLAARGVRSAPAGDGGAAPLRGDGVLLLAEELRTGDIAVVGSNEYADWTEHLLPWEECEQHLAAFCAEVGLPETAEGFVAHLKHRHLDASMELESGYEDNADLFIDDGVPRLKKRRSPGSPKAAEKLFEAIEARMPERSLLGIVA